MTPSVFVNSSIGSAALNGMFATVAVAPVDWRRPKVWSRNWPQAKPHCVTRRSENTFWWMSLMIRFDELRGALPPFIVLMPSA